MRVDCLVNWNRVVIYLTFDLYLFLCYVVKANEMLKCVNRRNIKKTKTVGLSTKAFDPHSPEENKNTTRKYTNNSTEMWKPDVASWKGSTATILLLYFYSRR